MARRRDLRGLTPARRTPQYGPILAVRFGLTPEQAEAMLKRLSRHFRQPVLPIRRYCDALCLYADILSEQCAPGRSEHPRGEGYVHLLQGTIRDIRKSNLLARLLYAREKLRTRPCPEHKGQWSGIDECPYGCGSTGWLPEPENRPTKVQIEERMVASARRRGRSRHDSEFKPRLLRFRLPEMLDGATTPAELTCATVQPFLPNRDSGTSL